jgi:hypothetical protein
MASPHYRNFIVRASPISPATGEFQVRVDGLVPGGMAPSTEQEMVRFRSDLFLVTIEGRPVNLLETMRRRRVSVADLYRLGTILSDLLLPGQVRRRFLESLRIVQSRGQRLRLRLILGAPELAPLPWEYLYVPPALNAPPTPVGFLALQPDVSIFRHEAMDNPEPPLPRGGEYRLVAAFASPSDQDPLNLDADRHAIEAAIRNAQDIGKITYTWVQPASQLSL